MESTSSRTSPLLAAHHLRFTYHDGDAPALRDITFQLSTGDLLVVMGASGAGKSTLCRCLNGIIPHFVKGDFQGDVQVLGQSTADLRVADCARRVGLVFQDFESQLFATNVALEVAFGAESLGLPRAEIDARVGRLLSLVGLSGCAHRRPASLSGGEKQRLAIAASLATDPSVIVLDEATSDLDPLGKSAVFDIARTLTTPPAERAVVFAHHDPEEALRAARVLLLAEGRPVGLDSPDRVLSDPERLAEHGVMALPATAVFQALALEERPCREAQAAELLRRRGLRIPDQAAAAWSARDRARSERYGAPIVQVRGVTHRYDGDGPALSDVSLTLRRGEYVAIIGQNGSGKTTLVKHFNGLLRPAEGEVLIDGEPTRSQTLRALAQRVGYVFQNPDHQIFAPTVSEEVAFAPRNFGLHPEEVGARVSESLAAVGFSGREEDDPFSLTKGERQRVAVASVLAGRPDVLIFDEPTTGLDDRESRSMMALIDDLNRRGHTIVLVTHAMWLAAEYAHRVIVMHRGNVVLDAPARTAFEQVAALREAAIIPPQVVRLSQLLGATALTVAELTEALRR